MQAVILAAGRGTRMGVLTNDVPKSMLSVAGKTILEWKLDALPESIQDVIIVVGYLGEVVKRTFGDAYHGKNISYVMQNNPIGGTMDALCAAKTLLRGRFVVMNGDDIHTQDAIEKCIAHQDAWVLAVSKTSDLGHASRVETTERGVITAITESDVHGGGAGLAGVGLYVLDARIFDVPPVQLQGRTETGLPQTMIAASHALGISIAAVPISLPFHFTSPKDIAAAEAVLSRKN